MPQLSVSDAPVKAYEGGQADMGLKDIVSKTNSTNQLYNILVVNAVNNAIYTINIDDGVNAAADATFTADASATKTEIRDGLIAAIALLGLDVRTEVVDADEFLIELTNEDPAAALVLGSTGDTPTDLTLTELVGQGQEIPFGRFVCVDEERGDAYCRLPRISGDIGGKTWGVALSHVAQEPGSVGYAHASSVSILNKGRVYMVAEDAVSAGGSVYVRYTANGAGKDVGQVRSDADSSKAAELTRAKFKTSAAAGALVVVELS